jgi:alpha-1,2-glucosyltransferase
VVLAIPIALFLTFLVVARHGLFGDEPLHADQIQRFIRGDFGLNPYITQLPGYHAVIALPGRLFGVQDLPLLRLLTFLLSLSALPIVYLTARALDEQSALVRTVQFVFFPILLPFFFLLYTDLLSLLLVVLGFLLVWRRHPVWGGIAGVGAVLVRQTDIPWLAFLFLLALWREGLLSLIPYPPLQPLRLPAWRGGTLRDKKSVVSAHHSLFILLRLSRNVRSWLTVSAPYVFGFAAFGAFVLLNGGVALGDQGAHPFPSFHLGNVTFALFLTFFFLLPLHIANIPRILRLVSRKAWVIPLLSLLFLFFYLTFANDHPYNQESHAFFLRNRVLLFAASSPMNRALYLLPAVLSILSLAVTRMRQPVFLLLYPVTLLFLVPSWLVEQRYYFIPFTLFLLFRERYPRTVEYGMAALHVVVAYVFLFGIVGDMFFL